MKSDLKSTPSFSKSKQNKVIKLLLAIGLKLLLLAPRRPRDLKFLLSFTSKLIQPGDLIIRTFCIKISLILFVVKLSKHFS